MPKLTVICPNREVSVYAVVGEMTIGRSSGNTIPIKDKAASRQHCRVYFDGDAARLEDCHSVNGTLVNGQKVYTHTLKHGDTIAIGETTIIYEEPELRGASRKAQRELPAMPTRPRRRFKPYTAEAAIMTMGFWIGIAMVLVILAVSYGARAVKFIQDEVLALKPAAPASEVTERARGPAAGGAVVAGRERTELVKPPADARGPGQARGPEKAPGPESAPGEDFARALVARDQALAAGNLLAARTALRRFATRYKAETLPEEIASRAARELADTEKFIQVALESVWAQARKAAAEKKYQLASQRCTNLLSVDASGPLGVQARELLTKMDEETRPRYEELSAAAQRDIRLGRLGPAADTLAAALDELAGTRWAGAVSAAQLQLLMARSLLDQMEQERARRAAAGTPVLVRIPGTQVQGKLTGISGLTLQVANENLAVGVSLRNMEAADVTALVRALGLEQRHVELAYLWLLLERPEAAPAEAGLALQDPGQAKAAARLLPGSLNLRVYDFSHWQQQTDWEALSGSWLTQNQKYVLEAGDGGDTTLNPDRSGGPFATNNSHLSFDFELVAPREGYFFACELNGGAAGGAGRGLSVIFSADGFSIQSNLGAVVAAKGPWTPGATHVDLDFRADQMRLSLGGKEAQALACAGLPAFKGTLSFRVREAGCAIDSVILRSAAP